MKHPMSEKLRLRATMTVEVEYEVDMTSFSTYDPQKVIEREQRGFDQDPANLLNYNGAQHWVDVEDITHATTNNLNLEQKMPDYCKCKGDNCNLRNKCLRFRVKPNKIGQSYFIAPDTGDECEYFMTIERRPKQMLTELEEPEPPRRASELEPGEEVTFGGMSKQDFYIEYSTAVGLFGPDSDEVLDLRAKHPNNEDFLMYANAADALKNQMNMRNQPDPNRFELSISRQGDGTLATFYIHISNHKVARTEEIIDNMLMVDYDSRDNVVGIEILGIKSGPYPKGFN